MKKIYICLLCICASIGCSDDKSNIEKEWILYVHAYYTKDFSDKTRYPDVGSKVYVYFNINLEDHRRYEYDDKGVVTYMESGEKITKYPDIYGGEIDINNNIAIEIPEEQIGIPHSVALYSNYCKKYMALVTYSIGPKTFVSTPL